MTDVLGLEIGNAVSAVFESNPSIQKAVVFGSRAKGSHSPCSDVDIALYGNLDFLEVERIVCELDDLPTICKFDVVAYENVNNASLREHIDRVGRVVYEKGVKK